MPTPVVDLLKDDSDLTMHTHTEADLGATLDNRYVNVTGDTMTGTLMGYITVDTLANILALAPTGNQLAFASDTSEFYLFDGSVWKVAPLELSTRSATPDMGAYTQSSGLGVSDLQGYYSDAITDKKLSNIQIMGGDVDEEGAIRTTTTGYLQVYLNGVWNNVVINFVLREDSDGNYELEHSPVGFTYYYEVMSGNSDTLGLDGKPIIQQYDANMGCYGSDLIIDFGTF